MSMKRKFNSLASEETTTNSPSNQDGFSIDDYYPYVPEPKRPEVGAGPFEYVGNLDGEGRPIISLAGKLLVDGIPRCGSERLMYLVTCVNQNPVTIERDGKRMRQLPPRQVDDESLKFYAAQIVHYGLKSSCEGKEGDKKVLLEYARGQGGKFVVPRNIEEMERRLKREWIDELSRWEKEVGIARRRQGQASIKVEERRRREEEEREREKGGVTKRITSREAPPKFTHVSSLTGTYDITANVSGLYANTTKTLELSLSSTGSHL